MKVSAFSSREGLATLFFLQVLKLASLGLINICQKILTKKWGFVGKKF